MKLLKQRQVADPSGYSTGPGIDILGSTPIISSWCIIWDFLKKIPYMKVSFTGRSTSTVFESEYYINRTTYI